MVERLATRFRALLGGRGEHPPVAAEQDDDDLGGVPEADPEWDELLAWARESEDDPEWEAVIAQAKQATVVQTTVAVQVTAAVQVTDEADEWGRLLALAKAIPSDPRPTPAPGPAPAHRPVAAIPHPRPPAPSIASLSARLERLAAQVPDARRRRAR